jgi:outer membrane protein OmpA-like peptidoglycan-associated protein
MACRPDRWLLGWPALAALVAGSAWFALPRIETDLSAEVARASLPAALAPGGDAGIGIAAAGRDVTITLPPGLAPDLAGMRDRANALATPRRVTLAETAPAFMDPFRFAIAREGASVVLTGGFPLGVSPARLAGTGGGQAGSLDDRTQPAAGAPEGFEDAAAWMIAAVQRLESGGASLVGRTLGLRGAAPDNAAYRDVRVSLGQVPAGFQLGDVDVQPPRADPFLWRAERRDGRLTLSGHVPSEDVRASLVEAARKLAGGDEVADEMDTARGLDPAVVFERAAAAGMGALSALDSGRVELAGTAISITGRSAARDALPGIEAAFRRALPAGLRLGAVTLAAEPPRPYLFAIRREGGRLTASGFLPTDAERATLLSQMSRRFPAERVESRIRLGDGAPERLPAVASLAIDGLAELAEGEVRIRDRELRVRGRILYADLAERVRRRVSAAIPSDWTAEIDIEAVSARRDLDAMACADLLADTALREPVSFDAGKAELGPATQRPLAQLADVLRRCRAREVRIVADAESSSEAGAASELATRRANALRASLEAANVGVRLTAQEGVMPGAAPPGRVRFVVHP